MAEERAQRRLAAILAADVVGYGRLMEVDEAGTLAALKARRRDVLGPLVARYQGRIFKTTGDGVLMEFASAINAVQCAVDLQRGMAEANAGQPDDLHIVLRIGVNLGDVIVEGSDLYGDGINIAARLESLAEPGGILISSTAHDHVGTKIKVAFADIGDQKLKNIAKPVRVYRVEMAEQARPAAAGGRGAMEPTRLAKVAIAVLPFDNMTGDPEQDYFSDGITEDIITELSRFGELLVIARNSSFQFRGKAVDVDAVGRKLGVQFVVEGSVRKIGNRVRVTVQLIEAASTAHVWADRYDRELTDIFAIQDEITRMITMQVARQTKSAIVQRSRSQPTESLSAYDNFLRAREHFGSSTAVIRAEPFILKAVELDPSFAMAHAMAAYLSITKFYFDYRKEHLEATLTSAQKALDLDPEEPWASCAIGLAFMNLNRFDEAGNYLHRALSLNPNEVNFFATYAVWLFYGGSTEAALQQVDEALRRDPYGTDWLWEVKGMALTVAGRYRDALQALHRMKSPPHWCHCYMAICHVELGQIADAKASLERFRVSNPAMTPVAVIEAEQFTDAATMKRMVDAMRRAEAAASDI